MDATILGLHHVTATVTDAQDDLDFYIALLGLRLVKKTVNFDNSQVFHFYYGNEHGTPGTILTTFPYKGMGVPVGRKGAGQITATTFSVPAESLGGWRKRLASSGVTITGEGTRFGDPFITFEDRSTLVIELFGTDQDNREPWAGGEVDRSLAIRGLHSPTLLIREPTRSIGFLTDTLGYSVVAEEGDRTRLGVAGGGPGKSIDIVHARNAPTAMNGLGTVHHIAMAVGTAEEQLAVREELVRLGVAVTEVRDRHYFTSIYFREPGGVLYEVATVGPGFTVDEDLAHLGRALKLPPSEGPRRAEIEAALPEVAHP